MILLRLAARNLLRNVRRSAITLAAAALGTTGLVFLWAYVDGINGQMIENSTRYLAGHLQLHRKGFHAEQRLGLSLGELEVLRERVQGVLADVALAPRVEGQALASGAEKTRGVLVLGVDPEQEPRVTTLARAVRQGRFLERGDRETVVLGDRLAEGLRVNVGDEVALVVQAADGSIGAGSYRVAGVYDSGIDAIDGVYLMMPLVAAQELYALEGRATAMVLRLERLSVLPEAARRLSMDLGAAFEVIDWRELLPSVVQDVAFHEMLTYIVVVVVFVVVTLGIANTILMAVLERTRELGVITALGLGPQRMLWLVLYEALLLGVLGALLGGALGVGLSLYFAREGIDFGAYARGMEAMPGLTSVVYPIVRTDRLVLVAVLVLGTVVASAILPAFRAARLSPVDAIRGVVSSAARFGRRTAAPFARLAGRAMLLAIALRAAGRNPRRTLMTVAATGIGFAAFLFLSAIMDGFFVQMAENTTGYITGHFQIRQRGFGDELDPVYSLADPVALLARVRAEPTVVAAAARAQAIAVASSPTRSETVVLIGIDANVEPRVTRLQATLREGGYLRAGEDRAILLGRKLADQLGVRLGERVVLMAQAADGTLGSAGLRLAGIYETGNDFFDGRYAFTTLPAAQALLALGERVSTVVAVLREPKALASAAAMLRGWMPPERELVTWEELVPEVVQMIEISRINIYLILLIVFTLVVLGVTNTLLMSVLERTREFGVLMALGMRPAQVVRLVIYESIVLGVLGMLAGFVLGTVVVGYFGARGLDLSAYVTAARALPGMTRELRPVLVLDSIIVPSAILFFASVAAGLYPAWRVTRLDPVQAIRHV